MQKIGTGDKYSAWVGNDQDKATFSYAGAGMACFIISRAKRSDDIPETVTVEPQNRERLANWLTRLSVYPSKQPGRFAQTESGLTLRAAAIVVPAQSPDEENLTDVSRLIVDLYNGRSADRYHRSPVDERATSSSLFTPDTGESVALYADDDQQGLTLFPERPIITFPVHLAVDLGRWMLATTPGIIG